MNKYLYSTLIGLSLILLSACAPGNSATNTAVTEVIPAQLPADEPLQSFSSDLLSLCFSYPQGYTLLPESETVEIIGPALPDTDLKAIFWLEISDAGDRTAEVIADQELTVAGGIDVDRSTLTVGSEQAVMLDGMPGQDLQRSVYVVHQQTLYMLGFMPARSENSAGADQMEALYSAVTSSWAWSPCPEGE